MDALDEDPGPGRLFMADPADVAGRAALVVPGALLVDPEGRHEGCVAKADALEGGGLLVREMTRGDGERRLRFMKRLVDARRLPRREAVPSGECLCAGDATLVWQHHGAKSMAIPAVVAVVDDEWRLLLPYAPDVPRPWWWDLRSPRLPRPWKARRVAWPVGPANPVCVSNVEGPVRPASSGREVHWSPVGDAMVAEVVLGGPFGLLARTQRGRFDVALKIVGPGRDAIADFDGRLATGMLQDELELVLAGILDSRRGGLPSVEALLVRLQAMGRGEGLHDDRIVWRVFEERLDKPHAKLGPRLAEAIAELQGDATQPLDLLVHLDAP